MCEMIFLAFFKGVATGIAALGWFLLLDLIFGKALERFFRRFKK